MVVGVRVRVDDVIERLHARLAQIRSDIAAAVRFTAVDQCGVSLGGHEHRIALPDIEKADAEAVLKERGRFQALIPDQQSDGDAQKQQNRQADRR